MIAVCLIGYIHNGSTSGEKKADIKYLLINPASVKDKFPYSVLFISMLTSQDCRYFNCSVSKHFHYGELPG